MVAQVIKCVTQYQKGNFYFRYMRIDARAHQWGMYVTTCGRSLIAPHAGAYPPVEHPPLYDFNWEHGRSLKDYQLVYIEEGTGVLETDHQRYRIVGGDIILLRPKLWHRYRPNQETGWREFWVGFDGPGFKSILGGPFFSSRSVFHIREPMRILMNFEALLATAQENGAALQQTMSAQTALLLSFVYASTRPRSPAAKRESSAMVQRARELMINSETRELSLAKMADRIGTSYSSFRRTFREHTGVSPHQYRLHLKLSQARELLLKTELSVKEIAFQSGFDEEQYFCRLFKKATGMTPSIFRAR